MVIRARLHAVGALDAFGGLERAGAPAAERRARIADLAGRLGADAAAGAVDPDDLLDRPTVRLLYTSPSPRDRQKTRMPSSA